MNDYNQVLGILHWQLSEYKKALRGGGLSGELTAASLDEHDVKLPRKYIGVYRLVCLLVFSVELVFVVGDG